MNINLTNIHGKRKTYEYAWWGLTTDIDHLEPVLTYCWRFLVDDDQFEKLMGYDSNVRVCLGIDKHHMKGIFVSGGTNDSYWICADCRIDIGIGHLYDDLQGAVP